jgi:hypothetical protein
MADENTQGAAPAATETPAATNEAPAGVGADEQVVTPAAETPAAAEQTPEQKAAADLLAAAKTPEEKAAAEAAVKAAETPAAAVEYKDFTLPEGAQIDDVIMGEFKQFGQDNKLTQEQMQGVLNLQQKLNERTVEMVKATREGWRQEAKNDKEFGGAKFDQSMVAVAKARDAFAAQPLIELFDNYGLSDHPEVLRHFYKLGQKISEDSATTTGDSTVQSEEPSAAEILYGKPKTK